MSYSALAAPPPAAPPLFRTYRESVYTSSFALPYYACFQTCVDEWNQPPSSCRVRCSANDPMPHPPMGLGASGLVPAFSMRPWLAEPRPDPSRFRGPMGLSPEDGPKIAIGIGLTALGFWALMRLFPA